MNEPVILFRAGDTYDEEELAIAEKYFTVYRQRCAIPDKTPVIARYSALPFYLELEKDLEIKGGCLANSYREHRWVADFDYYHELKEFTAQTWWEREFPYCKHPGPFVLKGSTNSRKHRWKTHMFAETRQDAIQVACELANDPLIGGEQEILYREYVPLKTFEICPISGLRYTNEYRLFYFAKNGVAQRLCHGYYWSCAEDVSHQISAKGLAFADTIADRCAQHCTFFVLDVAEREAEPDSWILIEVNDGQQSGLSMCEPDVLYSNLAQCVVDWPG